MYRNTFIIQERATWAVFLIVTILISVAFQVSTAPTSSSHLDSKVSKEDARKPTNHRSNLVRHFHHHRHFSASGELRKDTYALLWSLKKKQGPDGLSPVCRICRINFVDAKTVSGFTSFTN